MPHQCVHCGKIYEDASGELIKGCVCGGHFFFFVKKEQLDELKNKVIEMADIDKKQVEKEVREMIGLGEDKESPIVLDLESIRVLGPGQFEIDIVNLFSKRRPLIYKLEEGKYIIDIASAFQKEFSKDLI